MTIQILRLPQVMKKTGLSRTTIYDAIKKGKFPKPISLTGNRSVGWTLESIDLWIQERVYASTQMNGGVK